MSEPTFQNASFSYPALFTSLDSAAAEHQSRFFRLKCVELVSLALGAALGLMSASAIWGAAGIAAVLCFIVAVGVRLSGAGAGAERSWYDARAAAESVKSLSWQYAVGGEAFRLGDDEPEKSFVCHLRQILCAVPRLDFPSANSNSAGVTEEMKSLRYAERNVRVEYYRKNRIDDQVSWYRRKANWNKVRARWWSRAIILIELVAISLGVTRSSGMIDIELLGLFGAIGAGLIAWTQAKNYTVLSESYAVTSHEVGLVANTIPEALTEGAWAQSVHDAEAAFSREHTLWLARRQSIAT